jgi:ferredoxin
LALKIIDECIACDACVEVCPTTSIEASDPIYVITAAICCECVGYHKKPSCVEVCPVDAIVIDEDCFESENSLLEKYERSK